MSELLKTWGELPNGLQAGVWLLLVFGLLAFTVVMRHLFRFLAVICRGWPPRPFEFTTNNESDDDDDWEVSDDDLNPEEE